MAIIGWKVTRPITMGGPEQVKTFMVADNPAAMIDAQHLQDDWSRENAAGVEELKRNPEAKVPGEPDLRPIFDEVEQNALDAKDGAIGRPVPKGETNREPVRGRATGGYRPGERRKQYRQPYD